MTAGREAFLATVRDAVAAGNQAGIARELPAGPRVGYQGAGPNPVQRFAEELRNAGGQWHIVSRPDQAPGRLVELVKRNGVRKAVLDQSDVLARLRVGDMLRDQGIEVWEKDATPPENAKEVLFAADVGITGVDALIAETGSIVLASRPGQARSLSLLPPVHIAVAERAQIIPDLFDLFDSSVVATSPHPFVAPSPLPSCLTLITGPSKTGDIELRLVTGVHGPGQVHVVLIDS